jgi:hypothetical protein
MATRALIGYLDENREFTCTYNHSDGYPDHLGKILDEHFGNELDAEKIANEGYISYIDEEGNIEAKVERTADKINLSRDFSWEEALYEIADIISSYDANYAYIYYEGDGAWSEIKNTGKISMVDQLSLQLNAASNLWPIDENDVTIGDESIPVPENKKELKEENMDVILNKVKEIKPLLPGIDNDILVSFVKTHIEDIKGASDEDVKDEFEEFMSVNTEYVKEEDNVEVDYSDSSKGDDAIEKESASGAFEEAVNWRGETLKEQFKRLMK